MIILDTSYIIDFFKGKNRTIDLANSYVATTVVTFHEIISGVKHKKTKNEERIFRRFFSEIEVLDFDLKAAEKSSEIMASLLTMGRTVNTLDVLIAGIAITNGAEKIASTDKDFIEISKVTGLDILKY